MTLTTTRSSTACMCVTEAHETSTSIPRHRGRSNKRIMSTDPRHSRFTSLSCPLASPLRESSSDSCARQLIDLAPHRGSFVGFARFAAFSGRAPGPAARRAPTSSAIGRRPRQCRMGYNYAYRLVHRDHSPTWPGARGGASGAAGVEPPGLLLGPLPSGRGE